MGSSVVVLIEVGNCTCSTNRVEYAPDSLITIQVQCKTGTFRGVDMCIFLPVLR